MLPEILPADLLEHAQHCNQRIAACRICTLIGYEMFFFKRYIWKHPQATEGTPGPGALGSDLTGEELLRAAKAKYRQEYGKTDPTQ